jgi:hypothetical protein
MGVFGLALSLAPRSLWKWGLRRSGLPQNEHTAWLHSELMRHSARDIAEAGRELGRFDSRPWLTAVGPTIATVITTRDKLVPVHKQRELAAAAGGPVFEAPIDHLDVVGRAVDYNPALLQALEAVRSREDVRAA